ncbi:hypothetical protein C6N75_11460 [Streptomyces solincola]|uniref:Uncharacterized protein n=1 Tax=Streptomyces solincola TaxID=2100817 RepID=A0A2S9PXL2_9ACTN|nr:hypothetical protein [Streptomyces solincola]PRH79093.1 hypothetical protein C6N75_11460 [Streptomyces solincola]
MGEDDESSPARGSGAGEGATGPDDRREGGLSGLLATLGELLEDHPPEEIAVLLRAEVERLEFAAYAHGWRDAAAHIAAGRAEAARAEAVRGRSRASRRPGRTGRAAVIPFPPSRRDPGGGIGDGAASGDDGAAGAAEGPGTSAARAAGEVRAGSGGVPPSAEDEAEAEGADPASEAEQAPDAEANPDAGPAPDPDRRPAFAPKSRTSKVPTIPRLDAAGRPRPRDREDGRGRERPGGRRGVPAAREEAACEEGCD